MKISSIIRLTGLLVVLVVGSASAAPKEGEGKAKSEAKAEAKSGKGEGKGKARRDTYPLYGEVVAVSSRMLTIKGGEGKEDRKFTITGETKILNDEKEATLADVKVGKMVGGSVKAVDGDAKDVLLSINVGVKQDRSAPEKKGEGAKGGDEAKSKAKGKKE